MNVPRHLWGTMRMGLLGLGGNDMLVIVLIVAGAFAIVSMCLVTYMLTISAKKSIQQEDQNNELSYAPFVVALLCLSLSSCLFFQSIVFVRLSLWAMTQFFNGRLLVQTVLCRQERSDVPAAAWEGLEALASRLAKDGAIWPIWQMSMVESKGWTWGWCPKKAGNKVSRTPSSTDK